MNKVTKHMMAKTLEKDLYYRLLDFPDKDIDYNLIDTSNPNRYTLIIPITSTQVSALASTYLEDTSGTYTYLLKYEPKNDMAYAFIRGYFLMESVPLTEATDTLLRDIMKNSKTYIAKLLINQIQKLNKNFKQILDIIETDSDFDEMIADNYPFHLSFDELTLKVDEWYQTMKRFL